jgi:hypothetical protein
MEAIGLLFVATTFVLLVGQSVEAFRARRRPATLFGMRLETVMALSTDPILEALRAAPEPQLTLLACRWERMTLLPQPETVVALRA